MTVGKKDFTTITNMFKNVQEQIAEDKGNFRREMETKKKGVGEGRTKASLKNVYIIFCWVIRCEATKKNTILYIYLYNVSHLQLKE